MQVLNHINEREIIITCQTKEEYDKVVKQIRKVYNDCIIR